MIKLPIALPTALLTIVALGASACGTQASSEDTAAGDSTGSPSGTTSSGATSQASPAGPDGTGQPQPTDDGDATTSGATSIPPGTSTSTGPDNGISSDTHDEDDGPLLTTGNDMAVQWDVQVRYTIGDQDPVDGFYEATTLIDMDEFEAVVPIPSDGGGTHYLWLYGDVGADGVTVTLTESSVFDVSVEGTVLIDGPLLGGFGTLNDAATGNPLGTWETLSAVPQ
ncbi:MAG: hypothetical protein AAF799_42460 [Myxococcota bacterium]